MKRLIVALIVVGVLVVAVGGWAVGVYNSLVGWSRASTRSGRRYRMSISGGPT
jgi:hypothetical protein